MNGDGSRLFDETLHRAPPAAPVGDDRRGRAGGAAPRRGGRAGDESPRPGAPRLLAVPARHTQPEPAGRDRRHRREEHRALRTACLASEPVRPADRAARQSRRQGDRLRLHLRRARAGGGEQSSPGRGHEEGRQRRLRLRVHARRRSVPARGSPPGRGARDRAFRVRIGSHTARPQPHRARARARPGRRRRRPRAGRRERGRADADAAPGHPARRPGLPVAGAPGGARVHRDADAGDGAEGRRRADGSVGRPGVALGRGAAGLACGRREGLPPVLLPRRRARRRARTRRSAARSCSSRAPPTALDDRDFPFAVEAPGVLVYATFLDNVFRFDFVSGAPVGLAAGVGALPRGVRPVRVAAAPALDAPAAHRGSPPRRCSSWAGRASSSCRRASG